MSYDKNTGSPATPEVVPQGRFAPRRTPKYATGHRPVARDLIKSITGRPYSLPFTLNFLIWEVVRPTRDRCNIK